MLNNNLNISIIVPVYNVEKYLAKCLETLISQTVNSLEIIVVNDGSTDGCGEIIKKYKNNYPDLIISHDKDNGGLGSARNYGLQYARGEYIGFVDSDDYVKPDMFEKMYKKAKEEKAEMVICDIDIVNDIDELLHKTNITSYNDIDISKKAFAHKYGRTNAFNKLYHRDLFLKTDIRYPEGWFEDIPVTALTIEKANKIVYINEPLMCYVQREGSIMNQTVTGTFSEKNFNIFNVCKIIADNRIEFSKESYEVLVNEVIPVHTFLRFYLLILSINNTNKRNELINKWTKRLNELMPAWSETACIKRITGRSNIIKRLFFKVIINSFKTGNLMLLNLMLFLGGGVFVRRLREKNAG